MQLPAVLREGARRGGRRQRAATRGRGRHHHARRHRRGGHARVPTGPRDGRLVLPPGGHGVRHGRRLGARAHRRARRGHCQLHPRVRQRDRRGNRRLPAHPRAGHCLLRQQAEDARARGGGVRPRQAPRVRVPCGERGCIVVRKPGVPFGIGRQRDQRRGSRERLPLPHRHRWLPPQHHVHVPHRVRWLHLGCARACRENGRGAVRHAAFDGLPSPAGPARASTAAPVGAYRRLRRRAPGC
mmetsp:Transcript_482/g.1355  ORF Transcript_482/g.1355 Transcript_482/m.1355 type:complete len:241 (-) Transcript_482:1336-2058(-)